MTTNLMSVDVSKFTEKKNGLTYLSWAHAWAEALKADPAATFHVDTFQRADGTTIPYMEINSTGMVWVRVTMFGKEMSCFLPIMDYKNKPIQNPDSFSVNTAIMRCMTKALALHGLGLNIYAGEDLPMVDADPKPEIKPEIKPEKPPVKSEGTPGRWQITIKTDPGAEPTDYINAVAKAVVVCLEQATSQAEVMDIYKVNRSLFDKVKELDDGSYKDLMEAFKTKKDSF